MCPSSGETTVFNRHLVLVILCGWLSVIQGGLESTENNKYQVWHKHSCFSWWLAHSRPKLVEIDKNTKNKLCTNLAYLKDYNTDLGTTIPTRSNVIFKAVTLVTICQLTPCHIPEYLICSS